MIRFFSCIVTCAAMASSAFADDARQPVNGGIVREVEGVELDGPVTPPTLASLAKDVADLRAEIASLKALLKPPVALTQSPPAAATTYFLQADGTLSTAAPGASSCANGSCASGSCGTAAPARAGLFGRRR